MYDVLHKVKSGEIQITALNSECMKIKKMISLKKAFCSNVGVQCWEDALRDYPLSTSTDMMQKFLDVPIESHVFQQFCMKAVRLAN